MQFPIKWPFEFQCEKTAEIGIIVRNNTFFVSKVMYNNGVLKPLQTFTFENSKDKALPEALDMVLGKIGADFFGETNVYFCVSSRYLSVQRLQLPKLSYYKKRQAITNSIDVDTLFWGSFELESPNDTENANVTSQLIVTCEKATVYQFEDVFLKHGVRVKVMTNKLNIFKAALGCRLIQPASPLLFVADLEDRQLVLYGFWGYKLIYFKRVDIGFSNMVEAISGVMPAKGGQVTVQSPLGEVCLRGKPVFEEGATDEEYPLDELYKRLRPIGDKIRIEIQKNSHNFTQEQSEFDPSHVYLSGRFHHVPSLVTFLNAEEENTKFTLLDYSFDADVKVPMTDVNKEGVALSVGLSQISLLPRSINFLSWQYRLREPMRNVIVGALIGLIVITMGVVGFSYYLSAVLHQWHATITQESAAVINLAAQRAQTARKHSIKSYLQYASLITSITQKRFPVADLFHQLGYITPTSIRLNSVMLSEESLQFEGHLLASENQKDLLDFITRIQELPYIVSATFHINGQNFTITALPKLGDKK